MPSRPARSATGGGGSRRPRPAGRSGRVTTSTGRCAVAARRSSTPAANGDVPRETVRTAATPPRLRLRGGLGLVAQDPHGLLALVARRAVEDQDPVEVVDLVLDDARLEPRGLDEDRLAAGVLRADPDVGRALHVDVDAGKAQAALLHPLLFPPGPPTHR